MGSPWATPKTKNNFFVEITKPDHKLSKTFCFLKYYMFWLSSECFSILHDAFLPKSVIFSHSSCDEMFFKKLLIKSYKKTPIQKSYFKNHQKVFLKLEKATMNKNKLA